MTLEDAALRADGAGSDAATCDAEYRYEITARVPEAERPAFDRWFSGAVLDWATQPEVEAFRVWRGLDDGVQLRLEFTFPSRDAWDRFVHAGAHRERLSRLDGHGEEFEVELWTPAAVSVHGDDAAVVPLAPEDHEGDAVEEG